MRSYKLIAVIIFGLTWAGIVRAEDQPIEQQLVAAMNKVFGAHPGFRANHAKGIVVEGSFKASPEAAGLSRAVLFNGARIPVTVRFSDSVHARSIQDDMSPGSSDVLPSVHRAARRQCPLLTPWTAPPPAHERHASG